MEDIVRAPDYTVINLQEEYDKTEIQKLLIT